jgi:signal transduction histidine kinase
VWSAIALLVAGLVLVMLYREAAEREFDARLDVYLRAIIGEMAGGTPENPARPGNLGEPRFDLPASGWYWTVTSETTGAVLFASASLFGDRFDLPAPEPGEILRSAITGPRGLELRVVQRTIIFGEAAAYRIAVAGATDELRSREADFAGQVALTLIVLGIGLVGAIVLQVRIGMKPLAELRASLGAVRRGDADSVDEDLPPELEPLAQELNALVRSNREVVERARTDVGNLAHALKTPLSVILNELRGREDPVAGKVSEQAELMRSQVQHHLERARMAAQRRVIGVSSEVEPVLDRLVRAMAKIHRGRGIDVAFEGGEGIRFRGEAQDLEEMVGNLLDNACKWARSSVGVHVAGVDQDRGGPRFTVTVTDDGPGLSPGEMDEAVKRGRRLDETVPGTGLGLSIVVDLAKLYGGDLELSRDSSGGLMARLTLPCL